MDKSQIIELISAQKTAFIASVNEQGFPVIRAMLAPRKIDGSEIYFSTNTSSKKLSSTQQTIKLACKTFYHPNAISYLSSVGRYKLPFRRLYISLDI